jgi:hypothetical protein
MKLRKLGVALLACMAVAAVFASAASAAWEVEGKAQANGFTETVKVAATSNFTLVGTFLGTAVELEATGLECAKGVVCEITQNGATDASSGQLTFTGVKVVKPTGCSVATELTTNPLTDKLIMDKTAGSTSTFDEFFTDKKKEGEKEVEVPFIEITLTGTCAIAGTPFPVKGTVTGLTNNTGVSAVNQPLTFSAANQTTGGGSLVLGKGAATLTGSATNTLSGVNAGKPWGGS